MVSRDINQFEAFSLSQPLSKVCLPINLSKVEISHNMDACVIYGFVQVVCGGFVSLHNARLEGDSSIESNARGLSMIFLPICSPIEGVMSRVGQGTGFRSDLTASNTPPPPIVRSFLNIEYPISGGKSSAFEMLESIFVSCTATTSKPVVSKKDCSYAVFPLMLLMLIEHSSQSYGALLQVVNGKTYQNCVFQQMSSIIKLNNR